MWVLAEKNWKTDRKFDRHCSVTTKWWLLNGKQTRRDSTYPRKGFRNGHNFRFDSSFSCSTETKPISYITIAVEHHETVQIIHSIYLSK